MSNGRRLTYTKTQLDLSKKFQSWFPQASQTFPHRMDTHGAVVYTTSIGLLPPLS